MGMDSANSGICDMGHSDHVRRKGIRIMGRKSIGEKSKVQQRENEEVTCKYNKVVSCKRKERTDKYLCSICGWNPEEIQRRIEEQNKRLMMI